jgi:hypothetical protein
MSALTARELSLQDPKRFQKEYLKWTEYAVEYDWWEWTEDRLKETLAPAGVRVDKLWFSLSYSQGDYATFEGHIMVWEWMEATKDGDQTYADKYPALHLALADYGEDATVTTYNRSCGARANLDGNVVGNTYPTGIFSALEQDAWDDLVEEQYDMAGLEQAMQDYVDNISAELYTDLREEYEHLTSEESFIESCECNDITFEIEECEA